MFAVEMPPPSSDSRWTVTTSAPSCGYCGGLHTAVCPRVRSLEYHENGTLKRVEFFDGRPRA